MKYKSKYDIGEQVKLLLANDVLDMLKVLSKDTWLVNYPNEFIELLNNNYDLSLKAVRITPNIYFRLKYVFRNDKTIIKNTIKAFKVNNKLNEIDLQYRPIRKKLNVERWFIIRNITMNIIYTEIIH